MEEDGRKMEEDGGGGGGWYEGKQGWNAVADGDGKGGPLKSDGKGGYYLPHGQGYIDKDGVFHQQHGCMPGVSEGVLS